ncbi:TolC family protein [Labilibacter sediminis]|nr:TolC family protein [Labilibacter sediminis]
MYTKKLKLLGLFVFAFLTAAFGQENEKIKIQELLNHALENSFDVKEAKLNIKKSHELKKEVLADGLPQITGKAKYETYFDQPVMILPGSLMAGMMPPTGGDGTGGATGPTAGAAMDPSAAAMTGAAEDIIAPYGKAHNMDLGLQASQLLFSMQYINGVRTANKAVELYELQSINTETELIYAIYSNYYNLLSIYKNLDIVDEHIRSLTQLRQITESLVNADLALRTDLSRIDVNLSNLETAKQKATAGIIIQTNNLKMLAGYSKEQFIEIDASNVDSLYNLNNIRLTHNPNFNDLVNNRIEVKLLNKNVELNDLQIKTEQGAYAPVIAAYGSYMKMAQEDNFNFASSDATFRNVSLAGITMEIPIFTGRKNNAKVKQAKLNKQISINQREKTVEGLNVEYLNSINEYEISLSNCQAQKKNIELAEEVLNQFQLKYKEGLSGLTDVLLAETELMTSRGNYIENMTYFRQAEIKLLKAKGTLQLLINQ